MNRAKLINEEHKVLPSIIKSPKSTKSSSKELFKNPLSPYKLFQDSHIFKPSSISLSPDEFHHHKHEDQIFTARKFNRDDTSSTKVHLEIPQLTSHEADFSKKIQFDDIKTGFSKEYMQDTISSNKKKNIFIKNDENSEIRKESFIRNKGKNQEILGSLRKSEDFSLQIQNLIMENSELKTVNKHCEENLARMQKNLVEVENDVREYRVCVRKLEDVIKEKSNEVELKQSQIEELYELLRRSEEKKKVAIEFGNSIESNMSGIQKQLLQYKKKSETLQKDLETKILHIEEKDKLIEVLKCKISSLKSSYENEKEKLHIMELELEKTEAFHQESLLNNSKKLNTLEEENYKLQNQLKEIKDPKPNLFLPTFNRPEAICENKNIEEINKNEVSRWHSRCQNAENELLSTKQQLEKSSKNENYLKTQMTQKNQLIKHMERLILTTENNTKSVENSPNPNFNKYFAEIYHLSDIVLERIRFTEDFLRCQTCFKLSQKYFICFPCGHFCCEICFGALEEVCGKCAERVLQTVSTDMISKILNSISYLTDDVGNVRKFIEFPTF